LLVPAYFYPGGDRAAEWEKLLNVPSPEQVVVIVNVDNGPGKARDPNYAQVIDRARHKGLTVIGYVKTNYAKRPPGEVRQDVDRWVNFYPGVQGVFYDEQASAVDRVDYYAALYEHARRHRGLSLVVGNPGTVCAEEYLSRPAADVVCIVEAAATLREFTPPPWMADYPASRFAAVLYKVREAGRMKEAVGRAPGARVGYCYLTDDEPPNPWDRLPRYWEEELAAVRRVNER
jgi:hypothetical protein